MLPRSTLITLVFSVLFIKITLAQSISYSDLYDNSTFSRSIDLSKPVGAIDGAAGTSPTGAATYTVPIKCPPGTNGMVPNLSLVYNSQSGNGLLGQGWNLSGLSAITRAGWDEYHHGKTASVKMNNNDALVMDGAYLYPFSGSYGTAGAVYNTGARSFTSITSFDAGGGQVYFNVVDKAGTIMQFGNSADSRVMSDDGTKVMMWRLNMIQDLNGNYIWFTYTNTDRDSRISQIKYTGNWNTSLAPYNEINFIYHVRSDKNTVYEAGYTLQSKYLLAQVEVKGEGDVFKVYQLDYGKHNEISYLRNITEFNNYGGEALNDTRFKYGEGTGDFSEATNSDGILSTGNSDVATGDFDGDGLTDFLIADYALDPTTGTTYNTNLKIKKRSNTSTAYTTTATLTFSGTGIKVESGGRKQYTTQRRVAPNSADFNGDGRDDIIVSNFNTSPATGGGYIQYLDYIHVYYTNADGSLPGTPSWAYTPPAIYDHIVKGYQDQENYLYIGDFDGDGKSDLITMLGGEIYFQSPGNDIRNKHIAQINLESGVFTGSGFDYLFKDADEVFVVNMDGDAKSELMVVKDDKTRIYTFNFEAVLYDLHLDQIGSAMDYPTTWHEIHPGDFNGDGKTDILTGPARALEDDKAAWEIGYSTGVDFDIKPHTFDHVIRNWHPEKTSTDKIIISDFNGDGKSDIADLYAEVDFILPPYSYTVYSDYTLHYSTGSQFNAKKFTNTYIPIIGKAFAAGDFNGDSKSELFMYTFLSSDLTTYYQAFASFNSNDQSHLLEKVTDGFNRTTTFAYEPLTKGTGSGSGAFYTKGSGETYPVSNIQPPLYVATGMTIPDGIGGTNTLSYRYENMRLHRAGRGMLGFGKVITFNTNGNSRNEAEFDLNRSFFVPWLKKTKAFLVNTGAQLSQQDFNTGFSISGSPFRAGGFYPYEMKDMGNTSIDLQKGVTAVTSNTYDYYSNLISSTTTVSGSPETCTTTVATDYVATGSSAIPNRPSVITVTNKRGSGSASPPLVTDKTENFYNSIGLPEHITTYPLGMDAGRIIHDYYTYDTYGNITSKNSICSAIVSHPPTYYEYDSKGRFLVKETNPLGDYTTYTTHKFWGSPLSVTRVNGLTTTHAYDTWGKRTASVLPLSASTNYTITYSDGWDIGTNRLYYTLVKDPSAPDVKTWYDYLDRPVKTQQEAFGSAWTTVLNTYDARGNTATGSNPFLPVETPVYTSNTYDDQNRLKTVTDVFGGVTEYTYTLGSGLAKTEVKYPDLTVKSTTTDGMGKVLESSGPLTGSVHFSYDSRGNELSAAMKLFGTTYHDLITREYDEWGRLKKMKDHDAGTFTYVRDPVGTLLQQTDPKGKITNYFYDNIGRATRKDLDGYTSLYEYHDKTKNYRLKKQTVTGPEGIVEDKYNYVVGGDRSSWERSINGVQLSKQYGYDYYNRPVTVDYPVVTGGSTATGSGFRKRNHYDGNGFLTKITTNYYGGGPGDKVLYEATAANGLGQVTQFKRVDGFSATNTYYNGMPIQFNTGAVQDLAMNYNYANGNLTYREDLRSGGLKETFTYDAADRLTKAESESVGVSGPVYHTPVEMTYDVSGAGSYGQIATKSDIGTYKYGGFPNNAVKSVTDPGGIISHQTQDIVYNAFHKTKLITEDIGSLKYEERFVYDSDEGRAYSEQTQMDPSGVPAITRKRWYMDGYEMQETASGTQYIHYIDGDVALCGMVVSDGSAFNYYAVYTDHLGSITRVNDEYGALVAEQTYDAWVRKPPVAQCLPGSTAAIPATRCCRSMA